MYQGYRKNRGLIEAYLMKIEKLCLVYGPISRWTFAKARATLNSSKNLLSRGIERYIISTSVSVTPQRQSIKHSTSVQLYIYLYLLCIFIYRRQITLLGNKVKRVGNKSIWSLAERQSSRTRLFENVFICAELYFFPLPPPSFSSFFPSSTLFPRRQ